MGCSYYRDKRKLWSLCRFCIAAPLHRYTDEITLMNPEKPCLHLPWVKSVIQVETGVYGINQKTQFIGV
jgi:hypothetical protein